MPIINKDNIKDFEKKHYDEHYNPQVAERVTGEAQVWMNYLMGMFGSSSSDFLSDYETEDSSAMQKNQRYTDYETLGFHDLWR